MAAKGIWEVDPETRNQLQALQKHSDNNRCCDCLAPSPQWASPKFGVFLCLNCAGVHRGLGVHISFVRSITMDAFKHGEVVRMAQGGNAHWRRFFVLRRRAEVARLGPGGEGGGDVVENTPQTNPTIDWSWEATAQDDYAYADDELWTNTPTADRYQFDIGDEYKARLTARVDATPYDDSKRTRRPRKATQTTSPAGTTTTTTASASASSTSPLAAHGAQSDPAFPTSVEIQKDPLAAITKGFGWFTTSVQRAAQDVHTQYIQPTAVKIAESDQWKQAQQAAAHVAKQAQEGARTAAQQASTHLGSAAAASSSSSNHGDRAASGGTTAKSNGFSNFWSDFTSLASPTTPSAIGTSAMMGGSASGGGSGSGTMGNTTIKSSSGSGKKDEWESW